MNMMVLKFSFCCNHLEFGVLHPSLGSNTFLSQSIPYVPGSSQYRCGSRKWKGNKQLIIDMSFLLIN